MSRTSTAAYGDDLAYIHDVGYGSLASFRCCRIGSRCWREGPDRPTSVAVCPASCGELMANLGPHREK